MASNKPAFVKFANPHEGDQSNLSTPHSIGVSPLDSGEATRNGECVSSKKSKKDKKLTKTIKTSLPSVDSMVQKTNDDSVTSKRSAVACGYLEDRFLRYFVRKPSRRSPLVNRGYYLRMVIMSDLILKCIKGFLENGRVTTEAPVHVVSLGAGYDTLAFKTLLPQHGTRSTGVSEKSALKDLVPRNTCQLSQSACVRFCDIDFPEVMQAKAALMQAAPPGTFPPDWIFQPSNAAFPIVSERYHALGLDLRTSAHQLLQLFKETLPDFSLDAPIIFYAECVMQYMPPDDATRLIQCVATQFPHAVFISYDQICPSDSFGKVMVRSLKQKASPLLGISTTPDPSAIVSRLKTQGLAHVYFADFYDISRFYLTGKELARVEGLEPFDELEEWSEMCGHYGISFATNLDLCTVPLVQCPFLRPFHSVCATNPPSETEAGLTPLRVKYLPWPTARPCFEGWGNGQVLVETHPYTKGCIFIGFGGFLAASSSNHHRANVVFAHALCDGAMKVNLSSSEENPPELVFHSINRLSAYRYVVFGGRSNPTTPSSAAYLLEMVVSLMSEVIVSWSSLRQLGEDKVGVIAVLPPARYRHISVTLSESEFFIFGGRDARGVLLGDAWVGVVDVATRRILWRQVRLTGTHTPPAMCSAAAVLLSSNGKEVLLSGGLIDDGRCNEKLFVINTADGTCRVVNLLIGDLCARFSHTMTWVGVNNTEQILILGGCGWTPRRSAAPALLLNIQTMTMTPLRLALECPTWARHCSVSLGQGRLAIIGGGYTCFSFGTFSSKPCLLEIGDVVDPIQNFLPSTPSLLTPGRGCVGSLGASNPQNADFLTILLSLPHRAVREAEAPRALEKFLACMQQCSHPILLRHASLGPCVEKWGDPNYLKEAVKETLVSVHVASGSCLLDFVRKNFTFRHVLFQDLIQHTQDATAYYRTHGKLPDECWYFRSIATHMKSERANVWEDFKVLGQDFSLPDGVRELVMPKMHQSCLRINAAPLQLWTHYDTMENVLAQIVGHKRVILFPPSQYGNLYMSGSSSPVLNLDAPNLLQYPRFIDASKNALEVVLEPGDLLYFPANWHHHITTLADTPEEAPPYSLSINVFYRRFDCSAYDRKDLYGNKDLPAVVSLREKITEQVQELLESQLLNSGGEPLPAEYKEFALRQALHHLESVADSMATSL